MTDELNKLIKKYNVKKYVDSARNEQYIPFFETIDQKDKKIEQLKEEIKELQQQILNITAEYNEKINRLNNEYNKINK